MNEPIYCCYLSFIQPEDGANQTEQIPKKAFQLKPGAELVIQMNGRKILPALKFTEETKE